MAKVMKATGRKKFTGKRFGRKRGYTLARSTTRSMVTTFPRQLYPPLPVQFKASFTKHMWTARPCPAGAYVVQEFNLIAPNILDGDFPAGFQQMHFLYARSCVDRVQLKVTLTNITNGTVCDFAGGIVAFSDSQLAGNLNTFKRLCDRPESQTCTLGTATGGHDQRIFHFDTDVRKAVNNSEESIYCSRSTFNGVITCPDPGANAQLAAAPSYYSIYRTATNVDANIWEVFDVTYHITFSQRHAGDIDPAA